MTLYQTLLDAQAPNSFFKGEEYAFYKRYSYKLSDRESLSYLTKMSDSFGIIRANVVLRALLNKEEIERRLALRKKMVDSETEEFPSDDFIADVVAPLPYLRWEGEKIYVPIFPASLAGIYTNSIKKLSIPPYKKLLSEYDAAIIDPFDYYGVALFDSRFTKLVVIEKRNGVMAAYDCDSESLYFINDQGRLDNSIALFDKELVNPDKSKMLHRLRVVVDAYFNDDRKGMIDALLNERFISESLYETIEEKGE